MITYNTPSRYVYYNPNPKNNHDSGDCVIRAVTKVLDKDWDSVYIGVTMQGLVDKMMPSLNPVWDRYLQNNGFKKQTLPLCPDCMTVDEFAQNYSKGKYIAATGNHAIAVVDGKYYDSWDSGNEIVIYYFKEGEKDGVQ